MWTLHPNERLRHWQQFRESLNSKSLEQAVWEAQHLWSYAPFVAHYLTTDHIENWPNPWELLYENNYCDLAKALGIVYTLYLTQHCPEMELRIYCDPSTKEQYNLVLVHQGKYVLNYLHDEVVNIQRVSKHLKLKRVISCSELGLDKF